MSAVIPGSANPGHVRANMAASAADDIEPEVRRQLKELWLRREICGTYNGSD